MSQVASQRMRDYIGERQHELRFAMPEQIVSENELGALTVREFCRRYRLGNSKVYDLIKRDALRAVKCGRRTLILAKDAAEWERSLSPAHH